MGTVGAGVRDPQYYSSPSRGFGVCCNERMTKNYVKKVCVSPLTSEPNEGKPTEALDFRGGEEKEPEEPKQQCAGRGQFMSGLGVPLHPGIHSPKGGCSGEGVLVLQLDQMLDRPGQGDQ